ncbi:MULTISPECIES: type II toxin-antitoxin system PemK/MazF family toxin [unclassified Sulfurospirillum]|uniref:type II toxin-antitoxin system PemK/MazF family toxin n=1 Tax=unclassified Sulfurospirillum TaxID=2618290 RepID=UPI00068CF05B|nr:MULTISPECIES: type II toxin-antitoxin system PemK/MazF family toxin [unclassified Sulfurospirillum]
MTILQSEIWMVEFYPKVGSEIAKLCPAVVVSSNEIGRLPLKTIVPITEWSAQYAHYPWMVKLEVSTQNGLSKTSAVDCFQIKNFSHERFSEKLGVVDAVTLELLHTTIAQTLNPLYGLKR